MEKIKTFFIESKVRIITSLFLVSIIFLFFYINNSFLIWLSLGLIYLIGFKEAQKLFGVYEEKYLFLATLLWVGAGFFTTPLWVGLGFLLFLLSYMLQTQNLNEQILKLFLYPTLPMLALYELYLDFGINYLVWIVCIIAPTDIGAYVVGKFIGKTQFNPISPNKTWEGVGGGVAIATIIGTLVGVQFYSLCISFIVSFGVSAISIWGDLFESYLKRKANVKDSGSLMPGHGGVLDRIDGYLFGAIVMMMLLEGLS